MYKTILITGLALFAMFFGAGNIIFPLAVGQFAGDKNFFAVLGLTITAVIIPFLGVLAVILYEGSIQNFFGRIGKIPGFWLAFLIIALLGPLGSTPRCIALSYTTLKSIFPSLNLIFFSGASCCLIYLMTMHKQRILSILGYILTPALLLSLIILLTKGLVTEGSVALPEKPSFNVFLFGLKEGYNTMDLLAAFFFSASILATLKARLTATSQDDWSKVFKLAVSGSLIGAGLLAIMYVGFSYLATIHSSQLKVAGSDELLMAITMKIMGPYAGIFISITVALACLTTAIALISVFAEFLQREVLTNKISYQNALLLSLLVTFVVSTFEFKGIAVFLSPILQICYPALIVLTVLNILHRLTNFKPIKIPVLAAFIITLVLHLTT